MANIRTARRSGLVLRGGTERRSTTWAGSLVQQNTLVGGTPQLFFSYSAIGLALRPFTIVRTYLNILWRSDQAATSETQLGAVGVAVVTEQAVAIGATAVPTPVTDSGSESFLLYQYLQNFYEFKDVSGFQPNAGLFMAVESKAMRKVSESDDFIVVAENSSSGSGAILSMQVRQLLKLH